MCILFMKAKILVTTIFMFQVHKLRISYLTLTVIGIWQEYKTGDFSGPNASKSLSSVQGPLTIYFAIRQNSIKIIASKVVVSIYF